MWTYTLDVTGNYTTSVPLAGGNVNYTVASYRTNSFTSEKQAVTWTTQYSVDGGEWTTTCPSWLEGFTETGPGSTSSPWEPDSATLPTNDTPTTWEGSTTPIATTQASARDLSCYDIYGNFTGGVEGVTPYNTANCYVVSAPGWYRIPCVFGNAIKNGSDNVSAYTGPDDGQYLLKGGFKNHAHMPITSPWIKDNKDDYSATNPESVRNTVINQATLLWQDHQNLITEVEYDSDYVYFYVNPSHIFQGNALIAAKSTYNVIVWSWHIWVVDNPETTLQTKTVYSHPTNNHSVDDPTNMLGRVLGFCDTAPGAIRSRSVRVKFIQEQSHNEQVITINQIGSVGYNCTYYQWGRKDPMPPGIINLSTTGAGTSVDKTLFNIHGSVVSLDRAAGPVLIYKSIQNPFTFYYNVATPYNWCSTRLDNLWNSNMTATVETGISPDISVRKTIYDPCPVGFKTPNVNVFSGFSSSGGTIGSSSGPILTPSQISVEDVSTFETILGFYFYCDQEDHSKGTIFMPRTGSRHAQSGLMNGVGRWADFTTATPMNNTLSYWSNTIVQGVRYLTFSNTYIMPAHQNPRAYGFPLCPIRE